MAIKKKPGRSNSTRTSKEDLKLLQEAIDSLKPDEKAALELLMAEMSTGEQDGILQTLNEIEYKREPVDIETFVKDEYYLGKTCEGLRPRLLEDLKEYFESGYYGEMILTGSIGYGKTFLASICICRILYELSCMRNPHKTYGIAQDSNISVVGFSVTEEIATKVVFENIATKIDGSPYFSEHFSYDRTKKEMRFPNKILVAARAPTTNSVLGLNVIAAFIDEGNFMSRKSDPRFAAVDQAEIIYNQLKRRQKSRFQELGRLPSGLFIVSSKMTSEDFTARRIEASKEDPHVFVRDYALWEVFPPDTYSEEKFWVIVGNEQTPSRILPPEEAEPMLKYDEDGELTLDVPEGCVPLHVPEDFRAEFEADLEGSIRDIAGVATVSVSPYIQRREKIDQAIDGRPSPYSAPFMESGNEGHFLWDEITKPRLERGDYGVREEVIRPMINPDAPRHIHIDAALTNDCLGFAMVHIGGWKDVVRRSEDGTVSEERAPVYVVDCVLQVVPPPGDEIILGDVRKLIYDFSKYGYTITKVTLDQFQSADTRQMLAKKGYDTDVLSLDRTTDGYDNLKTALYEGRLKYYEYPPLLKELRELELHFLGGANAQRRRRKVDHPKLGSKDVADALAGAMFTLSEQVETGLLPMKSGAPDQDSMWLTEQRQSYAAGNSRAAKYTTEGSDESLMPPIIIGGDDDDPGFGGGWGGGWSNL